MKFRSIIVVRDVEEIMGLLENLAYAEFVLESLLIKAFYRE